MSEELKFWSQPRPPVPVNTNEPAVVSYEERRLLAVQQDALERKVKSVMGWKDGKAHRPARLRMHYGQVIEVWNLENAIGVILRHEATLVEEEQAIAPTVFPDFMLSPIRRMASEVSRSGVTG